MIGVDTNVLVRFLTGDDVDQCERVDRLLSRVEHDGERLRIDGIVLCELVWVLRSAYKLPRADISEALELLAQSRQFVVDDRDLVRAALSDYRQGPGDFADYLILQRNRSAGCKTTATFDRALEGHLGFEQI